MLDLGVLKILNSLTKTSHYEGEKPFAPNYNPQTTQRQRSMMNVLRPHFTKPIKNNLLHCVQDFLPSKKLGQLGYWFSRSYTTSTTESVIKQSLHCCIKIKQTIIGILADYAQVPFLVHYEFMLSLGNEREKFAGEILKLKKTNITIYGCQF